MKEIGGAFRGAFTESMREFKPDLILVSAGFDSVLAIRWGNSPSVTTNSRP